MTKRFAVIISGCGYLDGAEINETVLTLLNIAKHGAEYAIFAPNISQSKVVAHYTGSQDSHHTPEDKGGMRNVLIEAGRIARGNIADLSALEVADFAGLLLPGGFGVMTNLSSLATNGLDQGTVLPQLSTIISDFYKAAKPIGAICIAPALVAKVLSKQAHSPLRLTLGQDNSMLAKLNNVESTACARDSVVIDSANRLVTTPAFMYDDNKLPYIDKAIGQVISEMLAMCA